MKNIVLTLIFTSIVFGQLIPDSCHEIIKTKPLQYGVFGNYHLPAHTAVMTLAGFGVNKLGINPAWAEKWGFIGMVGFEFAQLAYNDFDPAPVYGSVERWAYDSAGDVIIPWLTFRAVIYHGEWKWVAKFKKWVSEIDFKIKRNSFSVVWKL